MNNAAGAFRRTGKKGVSNGFKCVPTAFFRLATTCSLCIFLFPVTLLGLILTYLFSFILSSLSFVAIPFLFFFLLLGSPLINAAVM